jgi:F-type H+-transporting ATPase subunit delta
MNQNGDQEFHFAADVGAQRVARVYAEALLNAAEKQHQADAVLEELESLVRDVFRADPQLEAFLASGVVSRENKANVLRSVFESRATETFANFLLVLNAHERLDLLRPILAALRELRDQRARRIRVLVRSAVPLPDDQRSRLEHELREAFRLDPVLEMRVEPALLGGLVVRVGDWVYDDSVRTRIETLRNQLMARSSHEIQTRRDRFSSPIGN